jgi:hypothetical protein
MGMQLKIRSPRAALVPALLIAVTLLTMSGACSQHEPGPYEGGGRTYPTAVIGAAQGNVGDDTGAPPPDVFQLPDVSTQDVAIGQ